MSPLFGHKDDPDGAGDPGAAVSAEIERIGSLSLAQLAAEVMAKGFGPGGPGGPGQPGTLEMPAIGAPRVGLNEIARAVSEAWLARGVAPELQMRFTALIAEGLQALEHASLIRITWSGGQENCVATRLGRAAAAAGSVERMLAGDVSVAPR